MDQPLRTKLAFPRRLHAWTDEDLRVARPAPHETRTDVPTVNLYGFMSGTLGLGQAARLYADALHQAGVQFRMFDVTIDADGVRCRMTEGNVAPADPRVNLVFVNPDHYAELAPLLERGIDGRPLYTIGMWFWELPALPSRWIDALSLVDEVWVATSFVRSAFAGHTSKPVTLMAPPLAPVRFVAPRDRESIGFAEDMYVFLFMFDFHSIKERKNPNAVIDAFRTAFPRGDENVRLLIKSSNGLNYRRELKALLHRGSADPRVLIRDEKLGAGQVAVLYASCDAYVSLHRSEGLGLTIAEAMLQGKPVIATNWSGNTDFMNENNSMPVDYRLVPVGDGDYPGAANGFWAEPDIGAAARAMRLMAEDAVLAGGVGARGRATIEAFFSAEQAGGGMAERLAKIAEAL